MINKVIHTKMDIPTLLKENNISFSLLLLLVTPIFLLLVLNKYFKYEKNLPPGPRPWPIIGNLHQVGKNPHVSTAILAQKHGPLISLRLGTQLLVVASSPEAATEILKIQDRFFSSRFIPNVFQTHFLPSTVIWSPDCNEYWRSLRTLCRTEMLSSKAIESQSDLRARKLAQMLDFLGSKKLGEVVKVEEVVFTTIFNTLSNIIFGQDFLDLKDENGTAGGLKEKLFKTLQNAVAPNISDFFPMLASLDLQGLRKETLEHIMKIHSSWEVIINERRSLMGDKEQCFLDRLLENGFSNDQINIVALELFTAGTDSATSTIVWAMVELIKNKNVMFKVQEELRNEIHSNTIVESDLSKLCYLNACIKETLRLHPPVPLLLPHRAIQTCEVMNYTVPHGTQIFVNVWAIGRDPKHWEDPLTFKPERFFSSKLDFRGQDFEFLPFGAGRRMCPGMFFGIKSIQSILASLILEFEWILPNDEDPMKLDMNEKFGVTLQKEKPLHLIFKHSK